MGAAFDESFKKRYRRNKEALEWYDALAMAVAVIALVFTFGVRIVKVDGHSMDPTLSNGERILINLLKKPDYDDIVVVDGYTEYGRPLVKRVIGKGGDTINIDFTAGIVYRNGEYITLDLTFDEQPKTTGEDTTTDNQQDNQQQGGQDYSDMFRDFYNYYFGQNGR